MANGYVSILLDASGSMHGQERKVTTGINEYMQTLQEKVKGSSDAYRVELAMFSTSGWEEYFAGKLEHFPELAEEDYRTGGGTPLYDALARSIERAEANARDARVLVIIDTDGFENSSTDHSKEDITRIVEKKAGEGWTFVFLGADMDQFGGAYEAARSMGLGMAAGNVLDMGQEAREETYHRAALSSLSLFEDASLSLSVADTSFWERSPTEPAPGNGAPDES